MTNMRYVYVTFKTIKIALKVELGKVAKKIVPFSRVSTLSGGGRGSAGIQIDTKLFLCLTFLLECSRNGLK